ncbi:MAG TPA: sigma-70 family RNA polymerase sigma factor [Chloroflexia bacterium]|nr:sigma-70 family RNA polymerase sigma factor [Chloroflexia bacterium]
MGAEVAVSNFLNFRSADFGLDKLFESKHPRRKRGFFSTAFGMIMHAHEADNRSRTSTALVDPASHKVAPVYPMPVIGGMVQSDLSSTIMEQIAPAQPVALTSAEQDRLLVQAALRGDQTAFAELVTRYQSAVYNMASRMLGDPTDAEDAAQEVFVRAWNQLHTFQQDRRFSTWLLSIASHHCIDVLRRRKPSAPLDGVALYVQSDEPEPDEIVLQDEQRDMVQGLINALPEKYRAVTLLRYYGDMSYDEISKATGLTESAVKTQLHRARRMLAGQLLKQQTQELGPIDAASLQVPEE